jgi:hypothetical protein
MYVEKIAMGPASSGEYSARIVRLRAAVAALELDPRIKQLPKQAEDCRKYLRQEIEECEAALELAVAVNW